jgi:uncharacterized membrane protein YphA (DoxX/SURF4 family)
MLDLGYKLVRWVLGSLFIYAGSTKLFDPQSFAVLIEAYGILPEVLLMPAAIFLSCLEVVGGIGMLFDIRGSLAVITGMLLMFMAILGYGVWIGLDVDCGCFGPGDPEAEAFHGLRQSFYRDLAMLAGIVYLYMWRRYRRIKPRTIRDYIYQYEKWWRKEDVHA